MGKYSNCILPEPFHTSQASRSALFLSTDSVVPLRVQMYWINKSGKRVHQNRLISNGVLNQFSFNLICSSDCYRVNISLIERSNTFYLYGLGGFLKETFQSSTGALKILTFNVWNMNSRARSQLAYSRRLERIISEIELVAPDIIGLQEVRFDSRVGEGLSPNQVEHFWRRIPGYDFVYQPANFDMSVGVTTDNLEEGLVIFSRYPITGWNYILLPSNSSLDVHQRICLHAQIATPIFPQLHLFLTHLSLSQELRLLAVEDILRFMSSFEGSKLLIGDMNAEPGSREMRDVREGGMEDAWLVFHSEPDIRTSEKVKGKMDRFFGLTFDVTDLFLRKRIDYIYIDQSLLPNAYSVELFGAGRNPLRCLSDHLGVLLKQRSSSYNPMKKEDMKIAVVCSSNQNRSMEAHAFLKKKDFDVHSFGSGTQVKLPGASMHQPNIYDFNTTYEEMYRDLASKDHQLYTGNGILRMLDRNRRIKPKPERFQDSPLLFDLILACEERVYDQVLEEFENRTVRLYKPVYVVNIDIMDNHEAATLGAITINDFCQKVKDSADLDGYIEEVIIRMDSTDWNNLLYAIVFY